MIAVWILLVLAGVLLMLLGSRRAVHHASALARGSRIPAFFIGLTLVALGTDLPEIANSIASSLSGHGDLNIGDSVGSVATQTTLTLGLLGLIGGSIAVRRSEVTTAGILTVLALGMGILLISDGYLDRIDAGVLLLAWLSASVALWRFGPDPPPLELPATGLGKSQHMIRALLYLAVVGAGAGATVLGVIELAALLGVPEYLISFFGASIGTSMPELVVDLTAIRRGEHAIAIGDIIGASLIDSTLSIGAGPLIAPTAVSAEIGIRGSVVAAAAVLLATAMLTVTRRHGRRTGLVLLACYAAIYPLLLVD